MPIRAICFDLDNTLWDVWPVIRRAERVMFEFLRDRYPRAVAGMTIESMRDARAKISLDYPHMAHDFSFLRRQALREQAAASGYPETMSDEAFQVFIDARNEVELYAEVRPALEVLRHSAAHILATAVREVFPGAGIGFGPAIEDGFYYDFEVPRPFTPEDLEKIESVMREVAARDYPFVREVVDRGDANRRHGRSAPAARRGRSRSRHDDQEGRQRRVAAQGQDHGGPPGRHAGRARRHRGRPQAAGDQ